MQEGGEDENGGAHVMGINGSRCLVYKRKLQLGGIWQQQKDSL
jgi:hypothetical protein